MSYIAKQRDESMFTNLKIKTLLGKFILHGHLKGSPDYWPIQKVETLKWELMENLKRKFIYSKINKIYIFSFSWDILYLVGDSTNSWLSWGNQASPLDFNQVKWPQLSWGESYCVFLLIEWTCQKLDMPSSLSTVFTISGIITVASIILGIPIWDLLEINVTENALILKLLKTNSRICQIFFHLVAILSLSFSYFSNFGSILKILEYCWKMLFEGNTITIDITTLS